MNKLRTHEHMCTPCIDCVAIMYGHVKNTCGMYTPACTGAQNTCLVHTTLTANTHIHPHKYARATVQQPLHHANDCNSSSNLISAQESARIHASPMAHLQLRCIIWSSAMVRAPSSLSILYVLPWPPQRRSSTKFHLHHFRGNQNLNWQPGRLSNSVFMILYVSIWTYSWTTLLVRFG